MNLKELKAHTREWRERYTSHKEAYPNSDRDIFPDEAYCNLIDKLIRVAEASQDVSDKLDFDEDGDYFYTYWTGSVDDLRNCLSKLEEN